MTEGTSRPSVWLDDKEYLLEPGTHIQCICYTTDGSSVVWIYDSTTEAWTEVGESATLPTEDA